jgi:hypothetical protein
MIIALPMANAMKALLAAYQPMMDGMPCRGGWRPGAVNLCAIE